MKIAIACDHGAYLLKNKVADHLRKQGFQVEDFGTNGPASCVDLPPGAAQRSSMRSSGCGSSAAALSIALASCR